MANKSFFQKVKQSFTDSFGTIVFGMEDGTVSIFGLVFGVAASAQNSNAVLLAGATGAIAAAVSMMAGTYLDVSTSVDKAKYRIDQEKKEIQDHPQEEYQEARQRLTKEGFSDQEANNIIQALRGNPGSLLKFETAYELNIGSATSESPIVKSTWMLIADLIATFSPVIPFFFFSIGTARIVSIVVTAILLILVGIGRAKIVHQNVIKTVIETLGIATAAALAGYLIGGLISGNHI